MLLVMLLVLALVSLQGLQMVQADPKSNPYIPFRTDPFDQPSLDHKLSLDEPIRTRSTIHRFQPNSVRDRQCPLSFSLGLSRRAHSGGGGGGGDGSSNQKGSAMVQPPSIFPVHPSKGAGRQVVHSTLYEHLDMLSPSQLLLSTVVKEGLEQEKDFPLLFESSSFLAAPIVHDFNGDGVMDALLVDYDGGMYFVGLHGSVPKDQDGHHHHYHHHQSQRFYKRFQVPRLQLRRSWVEARLNATLLSKQEERGQDEATDDASAYYGRKEPYHSYFEYGTNGQDKEQGDILRAVTADMIQQDHDRVDALEKRRERRVKPDGGITTEEGNDPTDGDTHRRRLQEVEGTGAAVNSSEYERTDHDVDNEIKTDDDDEDDDKEWGELDDDYDAVRGGEQHEQDGWADDEVESEGMDEAGRWVDDVVHGHDDAVGGGAGGDSPPHDKYGDDDYQNMMDDASGYGKYDDYYAMRYQDRDDYYDEQHYIRLPPHVLCTPVLADMKKPYSSDENEREEMIFLAVSYYFDEDEYEGLLSYRRFQNEDKGDESEANRGLYVATALVAFVVDGSTMRFGREEHLDLSADPTAPVNATLVDEVPLLETDEKIGAFALSSPTVADIDGNGDEEVLIGTSMGMVYCLHARHIYNSAGWPVQVKTAVESRILVEDVLGDTNLEVFVNDVGGNVYCFDAKGQLLWHRDLVDSMGMGGHDLRASSSMALGDVNGDGVMDVVLVLKVFSPHSNQWSTLLVAMSAVTGEDLQFFPKEFSSSLLMDDGIGTMNVHQKLPPPLLVDLHADQSHWSRYLYRNGTSWDNKQQAGNGGKSGRSGKSGSSTADGPPHGGSAPGLHIVQPIGTNVYIVEGGSGCTQIFAVGEEIEAMVQADDVHGTNNLDLVISTTAGNIITLESADVPYHPLNVWNTGEVRSRRNNHAQGLTASQGIFVRDVSRRYRDIFGVYVPVTFEVFDNRPAMRQHRDGVGQDGDGDADGDGVDVKKSRVYKVELRDGTSSKRVLMRRTYTEPGVYTERLYIKYGPGYYSISVLLRTSHGLLYEDVFHLGYNVHYLDGIGTLVWLPLLLAAIPIVLFSRRKAHWDDEDFDNDLRSKRGQGILGATALAEDGR